VKNTRFKKIKFRLRLTPQTLMRLRDRYFDDKSGMKREEAAFEAGRRILGGYYGEDVLAAIFRWKSNRPKALLARNDPADVADALRLATSAATARAAIAVLCGLRGIAVPVASAVMTAVDQERFTVIDFRALQTLGVELESPTIDQYTQYLEYCQAKSQELALTLRDLDRALWQHSKERQG